MWSLRTYVVRGRIGSLGPQKLNLRKMPESTTVRDVQQCCDNDVGLGTLDQCDWLEVLFGLTSATLGKPGTCLHVALYWSICTLLRIFTKFNKYQ